MCSAPNIPKAPPPAPPPPVAPTPYVAKIAKDPGIQAMQQMAARLGTSQLIIPLQPINNL